VIDQQNDGRDASLHADVALVGPKNDSLTSQISQMLRASGARVIWVNSEVFVRRITVSCDGQATTVAPDIPLLIRGHSYDSQGDAGQFMANEKYSLFWSAAALMTAPVINRPSPEGSQWRPRTLMMRLYSSACAPPGVLIPELYSSRRSPTWAHMESEDLWGSAEDGVMDGIGSRGRPRIPDGWTYQQVVVVGSDSWARFAHDRSAPDPPLGALSVEIARILGLHFCSMHWRLGPDRADAQLARITGRPSAASLGHLLPVVARHIARDLLA